MNKPSIVFLYAEITPYLLGCINFFNEKNKDIALTIIYNKVFPTLDLESQKAHFICRNKFKTKKHFLFEIKKLNPNILLVSGRMDSYYLYVSRKLKHYSTRVCLFDTIHRKDFTQYLKKIFSGFLYKPYFDYMWGVGTPQIAFALDIGYKIEKIKRGFYVADTIFFKNFFQPNFISKNFNFLFIGRLVKEKNIITLASVIDKINLEFNSNHRLGVIGEGPQLDQILQFNCVDYLGLKNQSQIIKISKSYHAFCLPSIYEPWGVVIHEMTALGLPILSSNKCGAANDLVIEGENGYKFDPNKFESIYDALITYIKLPNPKKTTLSLNSNKIARSINHESWNNTLLSFLNN